jgi:hypothetical protein
MEFFCVIKNIKESFNNILTLIQAYSAFLGFLLHFTKPKPKKPDI